MEPGFLQSREFVISATIAAIVVIAGVAVASTAPFAFDSTGCSVRVPGDPDASADVEEGTPRIDRDDAVADGTLRWALGANETLDLRMCTEVGTITLEPSNEPTLSIHASLRLEGGDHEDLHLGPLRWAANRDDNGLTVAVYHEDLPQRLGLFDSTGARLHYRVQVPAVHAGLDAALETDVGTITLTDIHAKRLDLNTDVGAITLERVDATHGIDIHTDVGHVRGAFATTTLDIKTDVGDVDVDVMPLGSATWTIRTDVGDVEVDTLRNATIGYNVKAQSDVGSIDVDIGDTERDHKTDDATGGETETRTTGFANAPLQVTVSIATDVGAIDFTSR